MSEPNIYTIAADVENLKGWQRSQNGTLKRLDGKLDRLIFWMLAQTASVVIAIGVAILGWALSSR